MVLLTIAPTGSVSCLTQTSSGLEPVFELSYTRRKKGNPGDKNFRSDFVDQSGDHWMSFEILHHKLQDWININNKDISDSPWYGCCSQDIDWIKRIKIQSALQKHIDNSISSTINLPENIDKSEIDKLYRIAYKSGLKGITIYRQNSRTGVLVDNKTNFFQQTIAPKRPKILPCDVHHITVKGQPYLVFVGLYEDKPYEVLAGKNGHIGSKAVKGEIVKVRKGVYKAVLDDDTEISPISAFCDDNEEALTRLTSTSLRHGADIQFVVHQLEKTKGDMQSFGKCLSRALKKYIIDGTIINDVCEECNSKSLVREEGCVVCKNCGISKCL